MTSRVGVADLLAAGLLRAGEGLVSVRGLEAHGLRADLLPGGRVAAHGQRYGSLSQFARTFLHKPCNGWTHATYRAAPGQPWRAFEDYRKRYRRAAGESARGNARHSMLYMLHPRACINGGESVYKVGKTRQPLRKRLCGYTKGTEVVAQLPVPDLALDAAEKAVLRALRQSFKPRRDYGSEYFEGDRHAIFACVCDALRRCTSVGGGRSAPWASLCGRTLPTSADAVAYLHSAVLPAMNQWLEVDRDGACTETYPDGTRVSRSLADTVALHQNRWLGWADCAAGGGGGGGGRLQVVPQWLAWHKRRQQC